MPFADGRGVEVSRRGQPMGGQELAQWLEYEEGLAGVGGSFRLRADDVVGGQGNGHEGRRVPRPSLQAPLASDVIVW